MGGRTVATVHRSVWYSPALLERVRELGPAELATLARRFAEAESSTVRRTTRAVARHFALDPSTPGVLATLEHQLELSAAAATWPAEHDLDELMLADARAAVLDMGLVISTPSLPVHSAIELAGPWVSTL